VKIFALEGIFQKVSFQCPKLCLHVKYLYRLNAWRVSHINCQQEFSHARIQQPFRHGGLEKSFWFFSFVTVSNCTFKIEIGKYQTQPCHGKVMIQCTKHFWEAYKNKLSVVKLYQNISLQSLYPLLVACQVQKWKKEKCFGAVMPSLWRQSVSTGQSINILHMAALCSLQSHSAMLSLS